MEADRRRGSSEDTLAKLRRWNHGGGWGSSKCYFASHGSFTVALVMAVLGIGHGSDWLWYVIGALLAISTGAMIGGDVAARRRRRDGWIPVEKEPWPMSLLTTGKWQRPGEPG
jgi:hypothetical protein